MEISYQLYLQKDSTKTKLLLYYSLIYPYLTYCNLTCSLTYVTYLNRIFLIQKRIVRAITNAPYRAHSAPHFAQLKLLDIYKLNSFHTAKFMFSYIHSLLPPPFLHLFTRNNKFHNYNIRTASNYRPHICRTNIKQFTILYQGPKVWNSLPTDITSSESRLSFRFDRSIQLIITKIDFTNYFSLLLQHCKYLVYRSLGSLASYADALWACH